MHNADHGPSPGNPPNDCETDPQISPLFFFPDAGDYIKVENVIYCIHQGILRAKSVVFNELFETGGEGVSDGKMFQKPIFLPQVTSKEFDNLLTYIYNRWTPPPYKPQDLVDVLRLSALWEIENGTHWAIYHIETLPKGAISAAHRLCLSRQYQIHQWIGPAFRELVKIPLTYLSAEDEAMIGWRTYQVLAKLREALEVERKRAAFAPPPIQTPSFMCNDHTKCVQAWKEEWWKKVGKKMLHPDWTKAMSFRDASAEMLKLELTDMLPDCRKKVKASIEGSGGFQIEDDMINLVIEKLVEENKQL
ncbi:hypothetical protein BD410DRAFT_809567 [Rickenella mellea]|uniref:BTB domain-containing protein n=1 Tax=Rickenella mellea TaxID=50990 RepID=A0A4Y7PJP0_9AGAM|nr:hypothetical protein BD410DRAFT_809567 [Rickenella mellea]